MAHVLLLNGGLQGIATTFSLKREKHYIVLLASKSDEANRMCFADRLYYIKHTIPFLNQVIEIISKEQIDVIIPMGDQSAEFLSKNLEYIETTTSCKCAIPKYETFIQGADKAQLMDFCTKHNFAHPRTQTITENNLDSAIEYIGFPAMIKPDRSVGARGITLVHNAIELKQKIHNIITNYGNCTLQEYINSENRPYYNVMLYRDEHGTILGYTIIEILRYFPIQGGSSSLCRTIDEPTLLAECTKILDALNWIGMADFDVLRNNKGEFKIIELNPRVPASLRAADIAGINFPEIIVNDVLKLTQKQYSYKTNQYLRYFGLDIMWFIKSPHRWTSCPNWFLSFGKDYYFQDIYAQKPYTWIGWFTNGFKRYLQKRKHLQ